MYAKHCFSAFACALTLGVATGGYAQSTDALAHPVLVTPSQVFHTPIPIPITSVTRVGHTLPKPFIGTTVLYQNIPGVFDISNYFRFAAPALPETASALLDVFNLPAGMTGTTGASVSDFSFMVRNDSGADAPPGATQDVYGVVKFYDSIIQTGTATDVITDTPLATYTFMIPALGPATRDYYNFVIPAGMPLTIPYDYNNQNPAALGSGFEVRFYDDAAHTIPSQFITAQFPLITPTTTPPHNGVEVGFSYDVTFVDFMNTGQFTSGDGYFFGGPPDIANLILQINGTAPNPATYSLTGTITFPTLTTAGPINVIWQIHPHSAGASFASDILITGSVDLTDVADPVTGAVTAEAGTYTLIGFPADTYDVDIIPDGFADVNDPNIAVTTQNAYGVDATFDTVGSPVTGNIALEGVADLSTVSDNAPLGLYRASFRAPGMTTELYGRDVTLTTSAGSPSGAFSATGIPDGTYDVLIKGSKNLAVLVAGVVVSGGGTTTDVTLPAGDANNDNSVDTTDFGLLVGSYGSDSAVAGGGYDPAEDFNFDGVVDTSDFGLLVGEYGNIGAM